MRWVAWCWVGFRSRYLCASSWCSGPTALGFRCSGGLGGRIASRVSVVSQETVYRVVLLSGVLLIACHTKYMLERGHRTKFKHDVQQAAARRRRSRLSSASFGVPGLSDGTPHSQIDQGGAERVVVLVAVGCVGARGTRDMLADRVRATASASRADGQDRPRPLNVKGASPA